MWRVVRKVPTRPCSALRKRGPYWPGASVTGAACWRRLWKWGVPSLLEAWAGLQVTDPHLSQEAVGLLIEESDLIGTCVGALVV